MTRSYFFSPFSKPKSQTKLLHEHEKRVSHAQTHASSQEKIRHRNTLFQKDKRDQKRKTNKLQNVPSKTDPMQTWQPVPALSWSWKPNARPRQSKKELRPQKDWQHWRTEDEPWPEQFSIGQQQHVQQGLDSKVKKRKMDRKIFDARFCKMKLGSNRHLCRRFFFFFFFKHRSKKLTCKPEQLDPYWQGALPKDQDHSSKTRLTGQILQCLTKWHSRHLLKNLFEAWTILR